MSSRLFQGIVAQMKDVVNDVIGVMDASGEVVACTDASLVGRVWEDAAGELSLRTDPVVVLNGYTFKTLLSWGLQYDYAVFVEGEDAAAREVCLLSAVALNGAKTFYDEKHDKTTFIKNILLDNILPGDIYMRSRELHFESDVPRVVILVRQVGKTDLAVIDVVQGLFPDRQIDFVASLNETDVALVKQVKAGVDTQDLRKLAAAIEETINSELYIKTVIGIGSVVDSLKDLAGSYKEAQIAIEVGKVFDTEKTIINFENLGIGRLIYQLPITMCEMFLSEVFKKNSIDSLDQETLITIQKFFENSLNVSETSRKLFVHRNTLVYRLEKIKKLTGLDLREFDHAIIFKVAMMVKRYLLSREDVY
ncbi:MAG: helix-turn-helix domain-containing protein [Oscillospiraceae bacterium]|jgi:carbohydrate diacid regulator|nr:helix-turn-helix domain-containing protein [Oscillospiraceae bacterium]